MSILTLRGKRTPGEYSDPGGQAPHTVVESPGSCVKAWFNGKYGRGGPCRPSIYPVNKRIIPAVNIAMTRVRRPLHNQSLPLTVPRNAPSRNSVKKASVMEDSNADSGNAIPACDSHRGVIINRAMSKGANPLTMAISMGTHRAARPCAVS